MKFKVGDQVIIKGPSVDDTSPNWLEDMDCYDSNKFTLSEKSQVFDNSWKVSAPGYARNFHFQEDWMTLVENVKPVEENTKVEKTMERVGPSIKTNDFHNSVDYEAGNPALHMLYTHRAMHGLRDLKSCLRKLNKSSQGTMLPAIAIQREIQKLIESDPAHRHAAALLFAGVQPLSRNAVDPRYPLVSEIEEAEAKAKSLPKCACGGEYVAYPSEGKMITKCFGCYNTFQHKPKITERDYCDCGSPDGQCIA